MYTSLSTSPLGTALSKQKECTGTIFTFTMLLRLSLISSNSPGAVAMPLFGQHSQQKCYSETAPSDLQG